MAHSLPISDQATLTPAVPVASLSAVLLAYLAVGLVRAAAFAALLSPLLIIWLIW